MPKNKTKKKSGSDQFRSQSDEVSLGSSSRLKKRQQQQQLPSSVVFLSHIPHGFFEDQMNGFFSQFGEVEVLKLARSKKTLKSKGYAYIKFKDANVALVVAETMDQYMLFGNTLKCNVLKRSEVHKDLFKNIQGKFNTKEQRKMKQVPWRDIAKARQNQPRDEVQTKKRTQRLVSKEKKKRAKLAALGIDYDFEGYVAAAPKALVQDAENKQSDEEKEEGRQVSQAITPKGSAKKKKNVKGKSPAKRKSPEPTSAPTSATKRRASTRKTKAKPDTMSKAKAAATTDAEEPETGTDSPAKRPRRPSAKKKKPDAQQPTEAAAAPRRSSRQRTPTKKTKSASNTPVRRSARGSAKK